MESSSSVKGEVSRCHPEDASGSNRENDLDDSSSSSLKIDDDELINDSTIPGTGSKDMPILHSSHLTGSYQTGVKGVIADATSFETARRKTSRKQQRQDINGFIGDGESDDEDFVRTWRKNRLAELRNSGAVSRRRSPSKRKYGLMETVDPVGYLDAIEKVSPDTIVVVTIYDDKSDESQFVEDCMNNLCRRFITTRFIKLHHYDAEMDAAMAPAVLAYKGGELFANILRIADEIPPGRNLSAESLELVLRRANVLHSD
jgi:hypothetical protein